MPSIRPVPYKDLVAIFEKDGFVLSRQRGGHLAYAKPGVNRPLIIPTYRSVPTFIIKNLLRSAGMSRERYFELLGRKR